MSAIVQLRVQDGKKWVTKRVQLLGGNVIPDADDGFIRYDFQPIMREIVAESRVFARLHKQIMFTLSSEVERELNNTKLGRKARLAGTVEAVEFGVPPSPPRRPRVAARHVRQSAQAMRRVRHLCAGKRMACLGSEKDRPG